VLSRVSCSGFAMRVGAGWWKAIFTSRWPTPKKDFLFFERKEEIYDAEITLGAVLDGLCTPNGGV
jgi:hypothetical protein